jgi:hypothetical protein
MIGGEDAEDIAILDLVRAFLSRVLAVEEKAAWLNEANMLRMRSSSKERTVDNSAMV